jgi:hypothetical protein
MADNLSVAVTADTSELRAQLALAQADLRAFGAETRKLANDIRAGGDAGGVLRGQLEQIAGQFNKAKSEVSELTSALRDHRAANDNAVSGVQAIRAAFVGFGESAALARERVTGTFEKIQSGFLALTGLLAGGALFGEAIRDVIQLDERVTSLRRTLGLSREAALQTDVALRLIGKSSDEYAKVLLRLEQQVRTNEARMNQLGVATRNAAGEYLSLPTIFSNAMAAIQTYKAGTDQAGVAQELFRRSAQEMFQFMDLTPAIFERATEVIRQYGIELQDHESMIRYRVDLAALGMAGEAVGHQLADQLMPALTGLAAWFTGPGAGAVKLFGTTMKGLATEVVFLQSAWQELVVDTQTTWDQINEILRSALAKGKAIMTGAWGELERLSQEHETRMAGIAAAGAEEIVQIELRTAAAMKKIFAAELGEGGDVHLPDVTVKGGTRTYSPPAKKGGGGRAKKPKEETDDSEAIALERIGNEEKVDDLILDRRKRLIEAARTAGKISLASEYQLLVDNLEQKRAADEKYYQQKMQAAQGDAREQQRLNEKEAVDDQEYLTKRQELDTKYFEERKKAEEKAAADSKAAWDKVLAPLTSSFDSAIKGFIQGTTTLQQALQRAFEGVLLDPLLKNVTNGLKTALSSAFSGSDVGSSVIGKFFSGTLFGGAGSKALTDAATQTGVLGTASTTAAAQVTAFGTAAAAATAQLGASGGVSAAGGVAGAAGGAASGGGVFGWLGGLLGFAHGGVVPSAAGGWAVPSLGSGGILAKLHSNEMVLPANISQMLQGVARGGGGGAGNHSFSTNIDARGSQMTAAQFNSMLSRSHNELSGMVSNAVRNRWGGRL